MSSRCPAGVAAHHSTPGLRPRPALLFCWLCSLVSENKSFQTQSNPPQNNGNKAVSPTVLVMEGIKYIPVSAAGAEGKALQSQRQESTPLLTTVAAGLLVLFLPSF